jgi:hypothetical protein
MADGGEPFKLGASKTHLAERIKTGIVAGKDAEADFLMKRDGLHSFNARGNLLAFPMTASLLRQRAFSFDHAGSEGFWDTYPGSLPFYVDRAHDVPDGAGRFFPEDDFQVPSTGNINFPTCWLEATRSGKKFGNENPCLQTRLGPGGRGRRAITQD